MSDDNSIASKSRALVPTHLERVIQLLSNLEVLQKLDESMKSIEVVDKLPLETTVYHIQHNKVLIANQREHNLISTVLRISPEEAFVMQKSLNLDKYPLQKGFIKQTVDIQGWHIKETKNERNKVICKVTFYSESNYKVA